jgi:hypothetical protein
MVVDGIWLDTAHCDMCPVEDDTVIQHWPELDSDWFPVLWCNAVSGEIPGTREGCDGVNHVLVPFNSPNSGEDDCYAWYQGNYKNGWVYWQGDWRCGPCAEKTIFGRAS